MSTTIRPLANLLVLFMMATSCATIQPTADVRDDVYFLPSMGPAVTSVEAMNPTREEVPSGQPTDDYYDANTSQQLGADRSYYDMTYNDPYYYNYGRFGFGTGLSGYQTGWNGPGWGMGMGIDNGYGSMGYGGGNCWGSGFGNGMGWGGGWNSNPYNSWNNPYTTFGSCYIDPYYNNGYGYGNYQSPFGSCYSCYTPVIVGGTSNVVVAHRPAMGSGGGMRTSPGTSRSTLRDPIRLVPTAGDIQRARVFERTNTGLDRTREQRTNDPSRRTTVQPNTGSPNRSHTPRGTERSTDPGRTNGGGAPNPSRSGAGDGGTRTSPSRR